MAQLRDAQTSEVVFEGSPLECVVHADELGGAATVGAGEELPAGVELVYDDVGVNFNPAAVLKARREDAAGLAGAARESKDRDDRERLERAANAAKAELEVDRDKLAAAAGELERARARRG